MQPRETRSDRPSLLVVATGMRRFREYLLASISGRYDIHMLLHTEPDWEKEYLRGWTVLESTLDAGALVAAARELAAGQPVDGVLCWDEARILQTSHVAAALGLPGGDPEMVNRCRDKHLTRRSLAKAGVPQPCSVLVDTVDDALAAAADIGYPVVLKPRALAASLGVVKVNDPQQLADRFPFTHDTDKSIPEAPDYDVKVLVEEFADGEEISIDAAVYHGEVMPFCLARKELGYFPYAEEVGHYVDAHDPLWNDQQLRSVLDEAHAALEFTDGVTHTEIMLTADGPRIIEVNARIGGDMIPYLGLRATGADPGLAAAAVACGQRPDLAPDRSLVGAVRFFYPAHDDTVIASVGFDEQARHPATDLLVPLMEPGDTCSPPPKGTLVGRVAYATAVGRDQQECRAALDAAQAGLRITAQVPEEARR